MVWVQSLAIWVGSIGRSIVVHWDFIVQMRQCQSSSQEQRGRLFYMQSLGEEDCELEGFIKAIVPMPLLTSRRWLPEKSQDWSWQYTFQGSSPLCIGLPKVWSCPFSPGPEFFKVSWRDLYLGCSDAFQLGEYCSITGREMDYFFFRHFCRFCNQLNIFQCQRFKSHSLPFPLGNSIPFLFSHFKHTST